MDRSCRSPGNRKWGDCRGEEAMPAFIWWLCVSLWPLKGMRRVTHCKGRSGPLCSPPTSALSAQLSAQFGFIQTWRRCSQAESWRESNKNLFMEWAESCPDWSRSSRLLSCVWDFPFGKIYSQTSHLTSPQSCKNTKTYLVFFTSYHKNLIQLEVKQN